MGQNADRLDLYRTLGKARPCTHYCPTKGSHIGTNSLTRRDAKLENLGQSQKLCQYSGMSRCLGCQLVPDAVIWFVIERVQAFQAWLTQGEAREALYSSCRVRLRHVVTSPARGNKKKGKEKLCGVMRGDSVSVPHSKVEGADNIIAALEHHDLMCSINFWRLSSSQLENFTAVLQGYSRSCDL